MTRSLRPLAARLRYPEKPTGPVVDDASVCYLGEPCSTWTCGGGTPAFDVTMRISAPAIPAILLLDFSTPTPQLCDDRMHARPIRATRSSDALQEHDHILR